MTPQQIELVRVTFGAIAPRVEAAAALFYQRLFEIEPALRPLFRGDIGAQVAKLAHTLGVAVASLDRLDTLAPTLRELGRRHAGYGVQDRHYDIVGEALLWTLAQGLGP